MLLLLFVVIVFSQQTIIAQVKTKIYANGIPKELRKTNFKINEVFVPEPSNFDALLKSKDETESSIEYKNKFAVPVIVDYDLMQLAQKAVDNNTINYNLKIIANKALNLSLSFSEFELSKNSILSISTDFEVTDSITSKENNSRRIWASRVYQGNFIYLTLSIPESELHLTKIKIDKVNFGFTAIGGGFFGNPGQSATCNINVLCPEGNGWENERNSVALIVSGGGEICTGTLVMNTCGSNTPYLLTANHCLNSNVQNWVFQFQTWSNTCNPNGTFREDVQFNGCQLRANNAATDFALVELNQTPPANSGISYSGWDRTNTPATSGSSIHHPQGDLMKISLYNQQAVSVPWISGVSNHWRVSFNQGIVQHGSSGSALYNQNRRLVGQLHGNQNNVCANPGTNNCWCVTQIPSIGEYGRFDLSWTGGGTNATRLSNWLDPNNTGAITTNTTNVQNLLNQNMNVNISITGNGCNGNANIQATGAPAGSTFTWTSSNTGIAYPANNSANTPIAVVGNGLVTFTLTVTNPCFNTQILTTQFNAEQQFVSADISNYIPYPEPSCYAAGGFYFFQATSTQTNNLSQFQWGYRLQGSTTNTFVSSTSYIADFIFPQAGIYEVFVRPVTPCGLGNESTKIVAVSNECMGMFSRLTVNPNPASNEIYINSKKSTTYTIKGENQIRLHLYELSTGNKYKTWKMGYQESMRLNIADVKNGQYILVIDDGNRRASTKVIIRH